MQVERTALDGVLVIAPKRHGDARGFFMETFRQDLFESHVPKTSFVQDNHSLSAQRGTVRGLHFQRDPMAQGKLVRCTRGAIWMWRLMYVKARQPTDAMLPSSFLRRMRSICVCQPASYTASAPWWPTRGYLQGDGYYSPAHDAAVRWNDPDIGVPWPISADEASLSARMRLRHCSATSRYRSRRTTDELASVLTHSGFGHRCRYGRSRSCRGLHRACGGHPA